MPTHSEKRVMPYSAAQMFNLVADVARYPQFLPWTSAARIRSRQPLADPQDPGAEILDADLVISFKVFREKFGSRVRLFPAYHRVETEYLDGPFKYLKSWWLFTDRPLQPGETAASCDVEFFVDFEFRNALLQSVIGVVFNEAMRRVVKAFEDRAITLYGPQSLA